MKMAACLVNGENVKGICCPPLKFDCGDPNLYCSKTLPKSYEPKENIYSR